MPQALTDAPARDLKQFETPEAEKPRHPSGHRRALVLLFATLAVVAAVLLWRRLAPAALPPGIVAVSGRIEGDDSSVATKQPGRLLHVAVREGDRVEPGQEIATLDDAQTAARESQAEAALAQADAALRVAQRGMAVLEQQLNQTGIGVGQARTEAEGRVSEAEGRLASAEAKLAQANAAYKIAKFNADAYARLLEKDEISAQQALQAGSNAEAQAAVIAAAKREIEAAGGALTSAKALLDNPRIRQAQFEMVRRQIAQQAETVASAFAQQSRAQAQLAEARANSRDLTVNAPFRGTVTVRSAEPGEVVAAGTPIVMLVDLDKVYLRAYVPENEIGRVRLGQAARVYLDSAPHAPLDAFVSRIDPQASFTPENTYFRDDRVKQAVGVKLQLRTPQGRAMPGMPADAEILVDGAQWPAHN